jgi:hypothetical protein
MAHKMRSVGRPSRASKAPPRRRTASTSRPAIGTGAPAAGRTWPTGSTTRPTPVYIDDDVREEYWTTIRRAPERNTSGSRTADVAVADYVRPA